MAEMAITIPIQAIMAAIIMAITLAVMGTATRAHIRQRLIVSPIIAAIATQRPITAMVAIIPVLAQA